MDSLGPWASHKDSLDLWDNHRASPGPWDNPWDSPGLWDNPLVVSHLVPDPLELLLAVLGPWVCHPVASHLVLDPLGLHPTAELETCSATLFRGTSEQGRHAEGLSQESSAASVLLAVPQQKGRG